MRTSLGMQSLSDCKQNLQAVSSVTFDVILPFRTFAENREVNHLSDLALFFAKVVYCFCVAECTVQGIECMLGCTLPLSA